MPMLSWCHHSGHGEIGCQGLRDKCSEAGLGDIILLVGGNLVVKQNFGEVETTFSIWGSIRIPSRTPIRGL